MKNVRTELHQVDVCVVGGGMAGLCAALSAARNGASVVLMHDRPVLGGNASSECRMHISGADRGNHIRNMRETGILEELRLANLARNPNRSYSTWDLLLYEAAVAERNLTLLLNCSCLDAETSGPEIRAVTGWQLTTQTRQTVRAAIFIDCSGDSILAPLTGAEFRMGREARAEYGESIAPAVADERTMGMTLLFQARQYDTPQPFEPPHWARRYDDCDQLPFGRRGHDDWEMGYWWLELGGEQDAIHDTESVRDELLRTVLGVWDHIKNRCPHHRDAAANWALEWLQFLPAKRESRRYIGGHVLTQGDIEAEGRFDDIVAYGGWPMDDHHPAGMNAVRLGAPATIFHEAPSPFGIPYRCLYSRNVRNLMFAGRNASCTHAAMSSTRVMGTCCGMGQAAGTAAALAVRRGYLPAEVGGFVGLLQQTLLRDDAYIPWVRQEPPALTARATLDASARDPELARDGVNRPVGDDPHCWPCRPGDWIAYRLPRAAVVNAATLILDSGLDQNIAMSGMARRGKLTTTPAVMPKTFRLEGLSKGRWRELVRVEGNRQRLRRFAINDTLDGVRFTLDETWGSPESRVYGYWLE